MRGCTGGEVPHQNSTRLRGRSACKAAEVDPLCCPECGGEMKVVSFIEPPQADVIEEILQHCGLWQSSTPRAPPDVDGLVLELDAAYSASSIDSSDQVDRSQELTYVDIDTFLGSF